MDVVSTVAAVGEMDPLDLPPLSSSVDPDALESLIEPTRARYAGNDVYVGFTFEGYSVTVHDYGIITVQPAQAGDTTDRE